MATCNVNTLLSQGKDFQRCSDRELDICIAQLLCSISAGGGGGGSQTPWTSAIDGGGFALSGAGDLQGASLHVLGQVSGSNLAVGSALIGGLTLTSGTVSGNLDIGTINGVKVYRALLTQSGTDAPVATVLENSLGGTVVWTRNDVGDYTGTLSGVFTANKTICLGTADSSSVGVVIQCSQASVNAVGLKSSSIISQDVADGLMTGTSIEILVYP